MPSTATVTTTTRPPRFLWRGLLILLPVILLAGLGLWQLRLERLEARVEAEQRAEVDAQRIASACYERFLDTGTLPSSPLNAEGRPLELADYQDPPLATLDAPPEAAELRRLQTSTSMTPEEVIDAARQLGENSAGKRTRAGLPVAPLAARLTLETARDLGWEAEDLAPMADRLCELAVSEPSVMTGRLLEEAKLDSPRHDEFFKRFRDDGRWRRFFQEHGTELAIALRGNRIPQLLWLRSSMGEQEKREASLCLITGIDGNSTSGAEFEIVRFSSARLKELLTTVCEQSGPPAYSGVRIRTGKLDHSADSTEENDNGFSFSPSNSSQARASSTLLANYAHPVLPIQVDIMLEDAAALYRSQDERTQRMAIVIALAVIAAGIGAYAAWRAFREQVVLAGMKDNFVSSVSHELRAPIASIQLMAEGLESGRAGGEDKKKQYSGLIVDECRRLGSLVENVLDYSRIESNREEYTFDETDAGELLRATTETMRPSASERGMSIELQTSGNNGELFVNMDARAVQRALVNLLDNAIKYGPEDSGVVVSVKPLDQPGRLRFAVSDQGCPIPQDECGNMFERFYRRGSELTREVQGVGIGLSLVRHIARAHGGNAGVESPAEGGGNLFYFDIGPTRADSLSPSSLTDPSKS